jgi:hypothetical protein
MRPTEAAGTVPPPTALTLAAADPAPACPAARVLHCLATLRPRTNAYLAARPPAPPAVRRLVDAHDCLLRRLGRWPSDALWDPDPVVALRAATADLEAALRPLSAIPPDDLTRIAAELDALQGLFEVPPG